ncbi:MAG: DUF4421 domain-containing protein [Bacteroidales bacterium]
MKLFSKSIILLFILTMLMFFNQAKSQQVDSLMKKIEGIGDYLLYRNQDTCFISNYGKEVAVRVVATNKYNYFRLRDRINKTRIRYRPVRDVSLGAGVSYKWFALDITFSLGLSNTSQFENTRSFDFQARMYSSKQYISATLQYYQAYLLGNISGVDVELKEGSERREDIRTITFGLQYIYAFNYTRFSMKAPFVFNEVQRKSAGSPVLGVSYNMFEMDADSSIIPIEVSGYFDPQLQMSDLSIISVALSFGYMYTYVYKKHYFLTLSLIPGINFNGGDYFTTTRNYISPNFNLKLNSMNAIGYNGRRFFAGFSLVADGFFSRLEKKLSVEIGSGKLNIFVGYRFGRK